MPYRRQGTKVQKKEGGKWKTIKDHPTVEKAIAHLKAIFANVRDA